MIEFIMLGFVLVLLGVYGAIVDKQVDLKYQKVARKKSVVRWDDDKAA